MSWYKDISGLRFGRLVAVKPVGFDKHGTKTWLCECDCGTTPTIRGSHLRKGQQSCGCWQGATHGYARRARHPLYVVWKRMRQRCLDPNSKDFKYYGGRGISICKEWDSFPVFLTDVGTRPHGLTLDRVDNNGNYEPGNVRWATRAQQSQNRRTTKTI